MKCLHPPILYSSLSLLLSFCHCNISLLVFKRSANYQFETPPVHVVVESRRKKTKAGGAVNVFQFAETVEDAAWDDEKQKHDLEVLQPSVFH